MSWRHCRRSTPTSRAWPRIRRGSGEPNDFVVRESYLYDVDAAEYTSGATVSDEGGTGFTLLEGPYVGDIAANYEFTEACFSG